jgi:GT2 family glycosyltransferase
LFRAIAEKMPVREAWLGLAAAHRALGDPTAAALALSQALSSFAVVSGLEPLADAIARQVGAPGWCGIFGKRLIVRLGHPGVAATFQTDDEAAPAKILAPGTHALPRAAVPPRRLDLTAQGRPLLGSPLAPADIRRCEGFVEAKNGGIAGWAWHPGDPDTDPLLTVRRANREPDLRITATAPAALPASFGFIRARAFRLKQEALGGDVGTVRVLGSDGRDLLGSPVDPLWDVRAAKAAALAIARHFPAAETGMRQEGPAGFTLVTTDLATTKIKPDRRREVDVVIPVRGAPEATLACLESVLASVAAPSRVVVVDDASSEPELCAALAEMARQRRIRLIRHDTAQGFPASANAGLLVCRGRDVVLLNSDTLAPPGWFERLREAAYQAPDIGTATPFSNSASILSYPGPAEDNPVPNLRETRRLAALAHKANAGAVTEISVGVGFCMYIRRDCLDAVGLFRTDLFAQGYGEENDFCLRARNLGWRHVAATGVFVAHAGGRSFGGAASALRDRNQKLLNRLHPGYDRLIAEWTAGDPLAVPRRRLDLARWRRAERRGGSAAILITHADGGGVERRIVESCQRHQAAGRRAIVLRPDRDGARPAVVVGNGAAGVYPNLRYGLPEEMAALVRFLRAEEPVEIELHHVLGHSPAIYELIARLELPYDVHVHDALWFCPRLILIGPERRYCGEPDAIGCDACIADSGSALEEPISVAAHRVRSAQLLGAARNVIAPSADTAARLRGHFPSIEVHISPHEDDDALSIGSPHTPGNGRPRHEERCRVCVIGAIGVAKGYDVLLSCARDAARRDLPLEFVVVGHTVDDSRLMATGRVFVTGEFQPDEATALIAAQSARLALLPSIWPETWCYALSDAWRAGLQVAAFDIGAIAERIRRTGRGFLLPLGLSASAINNALLAASSHSVHECMS